MKHKNYLKMMSLLMACLLCFQYCSVTGYAAEKKESWTLYFNPASPSSEWLTKCSMSLYSNRDYTLFYVSQIDTGVKINLNVPNAVSGGNKDFSYTNTNTTGYKIGVKAGHVYTYNVKYLEYSKYVNTVKGYVKYYN